MTPNRKGVELEETPRIVPVTSLRREAAQLIHEVNKSERPVFISQRGYLTAVLLSCERYEDLRGDANRAGAPPPKTWTREEPHGHGVYGPRDYETARLLSGDGYDTDLDEIPQKWLDPAESQSGEA